MTAVAGDAKVTIRWDPVPGAASYNLYRSRAAGVNKATGYKIENVTSPYLNSGPVIVNGTTFYFVVTAVNAAGEILESAQVSATPKAAVTKLAVTSVAASADDGNVPANTLDGNLSTRWSAQGDGQWIRYDLGGVATVNQLQIAFYLGDQRRQTFDIQASTDGGSWSTVLSGQSSGTTTGLQVFNFPDALARHVRVIGHGNSQNDWNSLSEVAIWGYPSKPASKLAVASAAASADDGNVPANTLDGDLTTRWSAQGDGEWIRYDLGVTVAIDRVQIAFYFGDQRTQAFDIRVSTDGSSWTTVFNGRSSGTTTGLQSFNLGGVSARYVRIVAHGNSQNDWNSLTEVAIWGWQLTS